MRFVHVWGVTEELAEVFLDSHWCDSIEQLDNQEEVAIIHRESEQYGQDWVCLTCGENTSGAEA